MTNGTISNVTTLNAATVNTSNLENISTVTITGNTDNVASGEGVIIKSSGNGSGGNLSVLDSGVSISGGLTNTGNMTNTGNIGTATLSTTGSASVGTNLGVTGTTTTGALSVTNNASVGGTLGVTGLTTTAGITNVGAISQTGTSTLSGTTNINASSTYNNGANDTNIGQYGSAVEVHGSNVYVYTGGGQNALYMDSANVQLTAGSSAVNVRNDTGTTVTGLFTANSGGGTAELTVATGTVDIVGTTNINSSINSATNINTGTSTGAVTVGNSANTTHLNSATNNIGVSSTYATNNNIGTNVTFASTNLIGNSNTGTSVVATGGNSYVSVVNGTASLRSGSGATASGLTSTSAAQTLSTDPATLAGQLNNVGDNASRQNIAGASYVNRLEGNTLINGNTYINGTLVYTSNTSATTTVTSGTSILPTATQATTGQTNIANQGGSGAMVDANGKITQGVVSQTTGSLVVTNGLGNTHGFVVTETQATISGGTRSSSLTLDDNGGTFSNAQTGAPVQVHGVNDGTADFDAVNVRQYAQAIAAVSASAHIPSPETGKNVSIGVGLGNFMGHTALSFGGNFRLSPNSVMKASVASGLNSGSKTVMGVGVGWSW